MMGGEKTPKGDSRAVLGCAQRGRAPQPLDFLAEIVKLGQAVPEELLVPRARLVSVHLEMLL